MSKRSSSKTSKGENASKTDWRRIKAMSDAEIDFSDIPEVTAELAQAGVIRVGGKAVPRGKKRLTMYLDAPVVEYFKAKAGDRGYQTLINEALKQTIERETLEDALRRILREEAGQYVISGTRRT